MDNDKRRKKVLSPVEGKKNADGSPGKTYWVKLGTAFVNHDNSLNLVLDALPVNGKLHVRDYDERDERRSDPPPRIDHTQNTIPF